ncbi:MAG: hypothetical protein WB508_10445 [Aeromicrobium sp.]|uniref:hypothetical protein n=1 Tax=Aeromicrobium sp. TaxID=1871063 RepID=UPI003C5AA255
MNTESSRLLWRVTVSLVLVAGALGAGWAVSQGAQQRSSLATAFDALPASTFTIDYTSWSDIEGSLDDAGLAGLTTRSVVAPLDAEMQDVLGWATSELDWEVYGRIDGGAISALGLGEISAELVRDSFAEKGSVVDGDPRVFQLDDDADVSRDFASTFKWVRVVPERHLVLAAEDQRSLDAATAVVVGGDRSLLNVRMLAALADRFDAATSALLLTRQLFCRDSTIEPDSAEERQLAAVLGSSGRLADADWGGRAIFAGDPQRIIFAAAFGSDAVAREQLRVRRPLTSGPFVGRDGQVADSLRDLRAAESDGVVSFDFALTPSSEQFMTVTGPVLFAGCAP